MIGYSLVSHASFERFILLIGSGANGKSVIMELTKDELKKRGVPEKSIFYVNFESLAHEDLKDYKALYRAVTEAAKASGRRLYIFLDEIQEVASWEKAINSFRVDFDCDIYVTGSNAKLLSGELATLLSGRYVEIRVYPLSFAEYLDFAQSNEDEKSFTKQEHFSNYLRFGGLPGIHQMKWDEERIMQYLTDIYNSVLLNDVIKRNKIRDTALLERIVLYLMDNIGNTFIKFRTLISKENDFSKRRKSIISQISVSATQSWDTVTTI